MPKKPRSLDAGKRRSVNLASLIVTFVVLFVAVQMSNAGFATSMTKITENLDKALLDLNESVNYRQYNGSEKYWSNTSFSPKGMAGLYNITTLFIDWVTPKDILVDGLIEVNNGQINLNDSADVSSILKAYWGLLLIAAILLLMVLFFPVFGLCFCCCRCCGNCGARSQPADKRRDLCKKIFEGTLLIGLGTALLFCVVCAFASNQQLEEGINNLTTNAKIGVKDTKTYITSVKNQVSFLLIDNFEDFNGVFTDTLNKSGETVMDQLQEYSKAASMLSIATFVNQTLPKVNTTLHILKEDTNLLRVYASQLNDAMRKVKKDLLNTLNECTVKMCKEIMTNISQLETSIDFNKLPDVSQDILDYQDLPIEKIQRAAVEGMANLENIKTTIEKRLSQALEEAGQQINSAKTTIRTNLNNVTGVLDDFQDTIDKNTDTYITQADTYIKQYGQYRYYGGLTVSCIFLLVTICIALGLICGICGKRPDGYSDNCCNKGAGSQFLICSVMLMFIFGAVIAVISLAMFLTGVSSQRVVCYSLRNPDDSNIVDVVDKLLPSNLNVSVRQVLKNCYENKSAYETFNLKTRFNLAEIQAKFDISSELEGLDFGNVISEDFVLLGDTEMQTLEKLKDFDISRNLEKFRDELKENFTNFSLDQLSSELNNLVNNISQNTNGAYPDIVADLNLSILHLNTYNEKLLKPLQQKADSVMDAATEIDTELKMSHDSFSEAIQTLIDEVIKAQETLQTTGNVELTRIASEFKSTVEGLVNGYIYLVGNQTENEVGRCGPLSVVINATLTATCEKVILPWNGFWFSLFWGLVLFLPTIIISVKLATLYQKYKNYGPYVETEYLYDAYADRGDSIPLNSRDSKRNKKKPNKKARKYEERPPNMGGEVVTREYAAGSHPPDSRYADIAPKHWEEFPNGGPPQYQRAPTEYERPPPYYYPGNAGEQ